MPGGDVEHRERALAVREAHEAIEEDAIAPEHGVHCVQIAQDGHAQARIERRVIEVLARIRAPPPGVNGGRAELNQAVTMRRGFHGASHVAESGVAELAEPLPSAWLTV